MAHLICKLIPEQTKLELYRGEDFVGYVREETITFFTDGKDLFDVTFEDILIIQDNWNQLLELQRKEKIFPCPHCGFVGREGKSHQLGPEDKSAICGSCGTPFNIGPED